MWPEHAAIAYAGFAGVAIVLGAIAARGRLLRAVPCVEWSGAGLLAVATAALVGAKLFSLAERSWQPASWWWEAGNGYRYPGALFGLICAGGLSVMYSGRSGRLLRVGDALVPVVALATAATRLGCWVAGCCHGGVTQSGWGAHFPAGSPAWRSQLAAGLIDSGSAESLPVVPLQLIFAASSTLVGLALLAAERVQPPGWILFAFLALDGVVKLTLEQWRYPFEPQLAWAAVVCTAIGIAGLCATRAAVLPLAVQSAAKQ